MIPKSLKERVNEVGLQSEHSLWKVRAKYSYMQRVSALCTECCVEKIGLKYSETTTKFIGSKHTSRVTTPTSDNTILSVTRNIDRGSIGQVGQ